MDFSSFADFMIYLIDLIKVFFLNGFITLFIVAKQQFIIFIGVVAVVYLIMQENQYIVLAKTKIKKRIM
jgi:hypothetical protein